MRKHKRLEVPLLRAGVDVERVMRAKLVAFDSITGYLRTELEMVPASRLTLCLSDVIKVIRSHQE